MNHMTEPMLQGKTHDIPKRLVWDAWLKVKENKGAAGVDGVTIERFGADLRRNLYQLWNRMSSGSYFPGPVRAVEVPKKGGTRILGIPNIVDRVAQTVAVLALEPELEKVFHDDSFGYRRFFAVSSGLLRVRWGQVMYAGLGLVRVGRGSLAAVR
jgi:RNA-directed DNA polymerase